jgi:hypothetical protein
MVKQRIYIPFTALDKRLMQVRVLPPLPASNGLLSPTQHCATLSNPVISRAPAGASAARRERAETCAPGRVHFDTHLVAGRRRRSHAVVGTGVRKRPPRALCVGRDGSALALGQPAARRGDLGRSGAANEPRGGYSGCCEARRWGLWAGLCKFWAKPAITG